MWRGRLCSVQTPAHRMLLMCAELHMLLDAVTVVFPSKFLGMADCQPHSRGRRAGICSARHDLHHPDVAEQSMLCTDNRKHTPTDAVDLHGSSHNNPAHCRAEACWPLPFLQVGKVHQQHQAILRTASPASKCAFKTAQKEKAQPAGHAASCPYSQADPSKLGAANLEHP